MKRMLAVSMALMLVAGSAFAISVSGEVMGRIDVLQGTSGDFDDEVRSGGEATRLRLEASGAMADESFGGWLRLEGDILNMFIDRDRAHYEPLPIQGYGWWQPSPMFWLAIGNNADGFFEQSGLTAWNFYRAAGSVGITEPGNAWHGGYGHYWLVFYTAFYEGFDDWGAMMTIRPIPELTLNFGIPFISMAGEPVDIVLQSLHAQAVFNQAWGGVALSYVGSAADNDAGSIFAYLNLGMVDNLELDFGLGFHLAGDDPSIGIGLGAQFDVNSDFAIRARVLFYLDTADSSTNGLLFDVLPFFSLAPNLTIFCSLGIALAMPYEGDAVFDWHLNPYVEVGTEWGPRFFAGFRVWSVGGSDGRVDWAVPVGIRVNF